MQDRDSLICDMAEYYHVLDIDGLPVGTLAALASGLPPYARSKQKYTRQRLPDEISMLALLIDGVNKIVWMMSEDGRKGKNRPKSIYEALTAPEKERDMNVYLSGQDFETARNEILRRGGYLND